MAILLAWARLEGHMQSEEVYRVLLTARVGAGYLLIEEIAIQMPKKPRPPHPPLAQPVLSFSVISPIRGLCTRAEPLCINKALARHGLTNSGQR